MYWSIETGKFREKFEVSNDTYGKIQLDCTICSDSNYTHISHFWLSTDHARELASALMSAVVAAEKEKK